jgi:hypothetical protein
MLSALTSSAFLTRNPTPKTYHLCPALTPPAIGLTNLPVLAGHGKARRLIVHVQQSAQHISRSTLPST